MIKRSTLFATFFLALFTGGTLFKAFYSSKQIKSIEETLTKKGTPPCHLENHPNKQMRSKVSKDLWISNHENTRLHHHIESPRSILIAVSHKDHIELVEQMIGMKCYLQEKIERDDGNVVQTVRYIQSKDGTYHYASHHFDASQVFLTLHHIPGETLPTSLDTEDAYFTGVAQEATLSLSKGLPHFYAEKFKGQVRPQ